MTLFHGDRLLIRPNSIENSPREDDSHSRSRAPARAFIFRPLARSARPLGGQQELGARSAAADPWAGVVVADATSAATAPRPASSGILNE